MKGVVFTDSETMCVKDFAEPLYRTAGEVVGGPIEVVRPRGLKRPLCFLCNEEGLLQRLPMNILGSVWYGTGEHGHPIVGTIVVMKEGMTEEGPDIIGLSDGEIRKVREMALDLSCGMIQDLDAGEE